MRPNGAAMIYLGEVHRGVVVLQNGATLPDGTKVRVETLDPTRPPIMDDAIYRLAELAEPTGIPDRAANIDYYLYGYQTPTAF